MVDHTYIEKMFGKKFEDLYPSVQKLLTETAEGHLVHQDIMERLTKLHQDRKLSSPSIESTNLPDKTRQKKVPIDEFFPEGADITEFFARMAKGMQYIGEQYGKDPYIHNLMVLDPGESEKYGIPRITYNKEIISTPKDGSAPTVLENFLVVDLLEIYYAKGHRVAKTQNPLGLTPKRMRLGFFVENDRRTLIGLEEADHAYWKNNPDKFEQKFHVPISLPPITQDKYDDDPLENHATDMMRGAIKPLELSARQVS